MAKRTSRPKTSQTQTGDANAIRNTPATADDISTMRDAVPTLPGNDSTRADSMASEPPDVSPSRPVVDDDIRARAYQRYLDRGAAHGQDLDDWIEAEQELRNRR